MEMSGKVKKANIGRNKRDLTQQHVLLRPWDEIVCTPTSIETKDTETVVLLTCAVRKQITLIVEENFPEKEKFEEQIKKLIGKKIAILKTDNPQKPLIIRVIPEPSKSSVCESPKRHTNSTKPNRVSFARKTD